MENLKLTKKYLEELITKPITKKEIHEQIIKDFNIDRTYWKVKNTTALFNTANISLRNKPRIKKNQI